MPGKKVTVVALLGPALNSTSLLETRTPPDPFVMKLASCDCELSPNKNKTSLPPIVPEKNIEAVAYTREDDAPKV